MTTDVDNGSSSTAKQAKDAGRGPAGGMSESEDTGMRRAVAVEINGETYSADVEPRLLLSDFIRHEAGLTGTHVGCEHGVCGACTVQLDGDPVRSCLLFAVQAEGHAIRTVEGMTDGLEEGELHPLQQAFHEKHGLQCGFCTPGFLMSLDRVLLEERELSDREIREELAGNLCRCTGYQNIVEAVKLARERVHDGGSARDREGVET